MDKIAKSEMMFGYFMIFEKKMYMVYVVYVQEKKRKREPWNGRGKNRGKAFKCGGNA